MDDEYFKIIDLEKHETKDNQDQHVNGSLTVVWRDWDNIIKDELKMIYVSSVNPVKLKVLIYIQKEIAILCVFTVRSFLLFKRNQVNIKKFM